MIFQLRSTISQEPFVRFLFCKMLTILFPFRIKTEKFLKISKFRNIFENVIFEKKSPNWQAAKTRPQIKKLLSDSESAPQN